jgi:hypothetical protein
MHTTRRSIFSSVFALGALLLASTAFADVTGTWAVSVESPQGTGHPTFVLEQKGDAVTGTYKGQLGEHPLTGTVKGKDISITIKADVQGQSLEITYAGTVDGNKMSGKATFGTFGEGAFTAEKQ